MMGKHYGSNCTFSMARNNSLRMWRFEPRATALQLWYNRYGTAHDTKLEQCTTFATAKRAYIYTQEMAVDSRKAPKDANEEAMKSKHLSA
jgi:hypothetical protein